MCVGAFGVDFSSLEGDVCAAARKVARGLLQHGVTSFCPTVVTAPPEYYHKVLPFLDTIGWVLIAWLILYVLCIFKSIAV